jgi:hypothetical protein
MAAFVPIIVGTGAPHAHGPLSLEHTLAFAAAFVVAVVVVWLVWRRNA